MKTRTLLIPLTASAATTYKVKVVFNESGTETMEAKILRIIRNEVHTSCENYDIMDAPQMSRQSERSAS